MKIARPLLAASVAAGLLVPSAPAAAHDPPMTAYCPATYLCVWWNSHYDGNRYQFGGSNPSWAAWSIANDDSSSYNHGTSGLRVSIYTGPDYTDTRVVCLPMGTFTGHHSPNDSGDSNVWVGSC